MSHIDVRDERIIDAKPEEVYTALIDYKNKRPRMLTPNFLDYTVEQGGEGRGTIFSYRLQAAGRERPYRMIVDEPLQGQVVTERDQGSSLVTSWTVAPINGGAKSHVSVESAWEGGSGVGGFFERTFAPLGLHKIYKSMLEMLTLMVQSPEKSRDMALQEQEGQGSPLGLYGIIAGAAVIAAVGLGILRNKRQS
jgi:hypothetical protein